MATAVSALALSAEQVTYIVLDYAGIGEICEQVDCLVRSAPLIESRAPEAEYWKGLIMGYLAGRSIYRIDMSHEYADEILNWFCYKCGATTVYIDVVWNLCFDCWSGCRPCCYCGRPHRIGEGTALKGSAGRVRCLDICTIECNRCDTMMSITDSTTAVEPLICGLPALRPTGTVCEVMLCDACHKLEKTRLPSRVVMIMPDMPQTNDEGQTCTINGQQHPIAEVLL